MYLKLTHLVQCSPKSERGGKLAFLANIKQKMPKFGSLPNPVGRWLEPVTCVMSDKQVLIPLLNFKSKGHFTYNQSLKMEFSFFFWSGSAGVLRWFGDTCTLLLSVRFILRGDLWTFILWLSFTAAGPEVHVSESEVESMRGFLWLIMEYA